MADEKPKKLTLKEIAERAAKTQPQVSPGASPRVTYPPSDPAGSQAPTSRPPTSQPPVSSPPGSVPPAGSAPPSSVPPASGGSKPSPESKSATETAKPDAAAKDSPAKAGPKSSGEKKAAPKPPIEKKAGDKKPGENKADERADEPASPLPFLVGGIVLVSIAALAYAMIKRPQGGPSAVPLTTASVLAPTSVPSLSAAPTASAPTAAGDLDINALGAVSSADPAKPVGPHAKDPKDKTAGAGGDKKPDTAAAATSAAPLGPAGELSDEIKKRMGGGGGAKAAADGATGPSPDAKESHPSPGAVAGALNAVRGAARACLADTEDVARVNIVFASGGNVQSASVTGTKAEGCVKSAMMKAKVAPFTDPSFSTSVTIRP